MYRKKHVGISNAKRTLLGVMAFSARLQTTLQSRPMLRINCPVSYKPLAPPLPLIPPLTHMYDINKFKSALDNIGTSEILLV